MPSPDLIAPARLEELLGGAFPETDREARLQGLLLELRVSGSPAPEALTQRVRALASSPRKRSRISRRRLAAVLVAACAAAAAGALVLTGVVGSRSGAGELTARGIPYRTGILEPQRETGSEAFGKQAPLAHPRPSSGDRARDIDMWIELRVRDADQVSDAATEATSMVRELGGFVTASSLQSSGQEGRAELALRVPVAKVEDAAFRLSQLGTITGQRVATKDLQTGLDRSARRIAALGRAIRIAKHRLASGTLDAEQRLQVLIRLERLRAERAQAQRLHARLAARAATAELTLVLHTREAPAAAKEEGRIAGAAGNAVDFLARGGSVLVFAAIALSPLALLAVLAWLALRARSRRIEARILERTRPGAPSPQPRN